jgi:hypothetical protein
MFSVVMLTQRELYNVVEYASAPLRTLYLYSNASLW